MRGEALDLLVAALEISRNQWEERGDRGDPVWHVELAPGVCISRWDHWLSGRRARGEYVAVLASTMETAIEIARVAVVMAATGTSHQDAVPVLRRMWSYHPQKQHINRHQ